MAADLDRAIAASWSFRARSERAAAVRFHRLTGELAAVDAEPVAVTLAERAAKDEREHAERCAEVALRWGAPPADVHGPIEPDRPAGPPQLSQADRVLYEVVAFCCISETLNVHLLTTTLDHVREREIREATRAILKDEISHARLGWAHLAAARKRGQGAFLGPMIPLMLGAAISGDELAGESPTSLALREHGELSLPMKRAILRDSLEAVILPGLRSNGVDPGPGRAWLKELGTKWSNAA